MASDQAAAEVVDRGRLTGALVRAIALYPREAQRHTARVGVEDWIPSKAISTSSGRTSTAIPCRPVSRGRSSFVCHSRSSSVSPLKVFPTITKSPVLGSRALR